jgi:hypothetical protein
MRKKCEDAERKEIMCVIYALCRRSFCNLFEDNRQSSFGHHSYSLFREHGEINAVDADKGERERRIFKNKLCRLWLIKAILGN